MQNFLDFEKPLLEIRTKIEELRHLKDTSENIANELTVLQEKFDKTLDEIYNNLSPIQKVKVCRHQDRPKFDEIIKNIFDKFEVICGDRLFSEDSSIKGGLARIENRNFLVIGNDKGIDIDSRVKNNFGMAKPEGYRKAQRLFKLASKFKIPVVTFIDTPGAFPGVEAEDRGQSEAIASSIKCSLNVEAPIFSFIIGEGGSGGAVALATGNRVIMLEHAVYSVISPEGCASILWRSANESEKAARSLKLTAQDLLELEVIDEIITEPRGGAHRDVIGVCGQIKDCILKVSKEFDGISPEKVVSQREDKYLSIGKKFLDN
ncbi:MAG: acetyl-CoA carboxylase carboxyl transferase subunit alpha [Pelagibacteraceae bacterium TMED65]|nr:acetyl-CoA carboxylase carboxyl transferase subunit alpha [Rickettsiales bacterium]OUU51226.1 MAG: acetyl-CoA carboxylase carboxyl transferase subunit alpha [Pelagibacteraceae bacterium TMED65]|tara:strand:+ start:2064 stop:3020 length:957 start_codon:yes stop_codon:yes gene_type:complete